MSRTSPRVDSRELPFVPLDPPVAGVPARPTRRRAPGPRWGMRCLLLDLRARRTHGDGALLLLCVLLMLATIAGAVALVVLAT